MRDKVYLLYNSLDVQKDQILHPAVPLQQLKRHLNEHILDGDLQETKVPLLPNDDIYLQTRDNEPGSASDALVHFDECDRLLAILSAERDGRLVLSTSQKAELQNRLRRFQTDFSLIPATADKSARPPTVSLRDLSRYLEFPVPAALKYHLRLQDKEQEDLTEDEPFVSDQRTASGLIRQMLNWVVQRSLQVGVEQTMSEWRQALPFTLSGMVVAGLVPEEAFGEVDQDILQRELQERINVLARFLNPRQHVPYCGPLLLGESVVPLGAASTSPP